VATAAAASGLSLAHSPAAADGWHPRTPHALAHIKHHTNAQQPAYHTVDENRTPGESASAPTHQAQPHVEQQQATAASAEAASIYEGGAEVVGGEGYRTEMHVGGASVGAEGEIAYASIDSNVYVHAVEGVEHGQHGSTYPLSPSVIGDQVGDGVGMVEEEQPAAEVPQAYDGVAVGWGAQAEYIEDEEPTSPPPAYDEAPPAYQDYVQDTHTHTHTHTHDAMQCAANTESVEIVEGAATNSIYSLGADASLYSQPSDPNLYSQVDEPADHPPHTSAQTPIHQQNAENSIYTEPASMENSLYSQPTITMENFTYSQTADASIYNQPSAIYFQTTDASIYSQPSSIYEQTGSTYAGQNAQAAQEAAIPVPSAEQQQRAAAAAATEAEQEAAAVYAQPFEEASAAAAAAAQQHQEEAAAAVAAMTAAQQQQKQAEAAEAAAAAEHKKQQQAEAAAAEAKESAAAAAAAQQAAALAAEEHTRRERERERQTELQRIGSGAAVLPEVMDQICIQLEAELKALKHEASTLTHQQGHVRQEREAVMSRLRQVTRQIAGVESAQLDAQEREDYEVSVHFLYLNQIVWSHCSY
jgi:hypothetical protein